MPHINTGPGHHDHTSSAIIVHCENKVPKIILHIHKEVGTFLPFGGHIERDETPWQCLVREIREESGYDISQLKILQPKGSLRKLGKLNVHPLPFMHVTYSYDNIDHFHSDLKYIFITYEKPKYKPDDSESEIIKSFSRQQIADLPEKQLEEYDRELYLHVFDKLLDELEPIDPGVFKS